jgi:hypothetical protein
MRDLCHPLNFCGAQGHAVAAYLLDREFTSVTVVREGETLGRCALSKLDDFHPDSTVDNRTLVHSEEYMIMLYSGLASEYLVTGRYNRAGAHSDLVKASQLAGNACGSHEEERLYEKLMLVRAKNLLRLAQNWSGVQTLAQELLIRPRLTYPEARELIEKGMEKEGKCLKCGSPAAFVDPVKGGFVCLDHGKS